MSSQFSPEFMCNFTDIVEVKDINKCSELWSCNWISILNSDFVVDFCKKFSKFSKSTTITEDSETILKSAIAFLFAFLQENFTGPKISDEYEKFSKDNIRDNLKNVGHIAVDSEEINENVKYPEFLICSKKLFQILLEKHPKDILVNWWFLRLLCTHQKILDELTNTIYIQFKSIAEYLLEHVNTLNNKEHELLLYIEISQGFLLFHRIIKYEDIFKNVCDKFNIELKIEGLLGIRTKYQQSPLPQLCLKVFMTNKNCLPAAKLTNGSTILPKLLKHEDDVRLEKIKFCNEEDNDVITLPSILQIFVLSKLKYVLRSQPKDCLASEELEPYITTLLYQEHGPFTIRLTTLFYNIAQESNHKRTVERCLKQSEEISNIICGDKYTIFERFSYAFASTLPPIWEFQKQLGDLMISLGFVKTALDIYLQIQAWEEVIECYTRLELKHKAAEIIEQELIKCPTVKLYCLLGDATDNVKYFEKAWKFSNETSGRAQRHWGNNYFAKKDYVTALKHLQKTLEINPLQEIQWLRLGYAAIQLENWELAVQAYLRYTHLEPHGFESWNNLAKALIKLGDKKRAHKILNESLKCNYNNWKVWENFMLVSLDTGNFEDCLNAYSRLVELREKEKFFDIEVLEITVNAIATNIPDANGRPSERLSKKACKLLGHQCCKYPNEWKLWKLSASISGNVLNSSIKLQKCLRAYMQKESNWTQIKEKSIECLNICLEMCEKSLTANDKHEDSERTQVKSQLSSARLNTQACISLMENKNAEKWEETDCLLNKLKELLEKLTNEVKKYMF